MALLAVSVSSTFVPGLPEVTLVYYVQGLHWNAFEVALLFALGQCGVFSLTYVAGDALIRRWSWFDRNVSAVRTRFQAHLETRFLTLGVVAGVFGVPPPLALAALAPGFEIPPRHLLPILYVGRVVRFLALILFGAELTALWHRFWP